MEAYKTYEKWLSTRPGSVQRLALEFPYGQRFLLPSGDFLYALGYKEDDMLILTPIDPIEDYEEANVQRFYVWAQHIRDATVSEEQL